MSIRSSLSLPILLLLGCATSTHPTTPSSLGLSRTSKELLAVIDQPGTLEVETVTSADWAVSRKGLINLDHPKAKEAGLEDGDEAIQLFFHVVRHPTEGTFIIDTGVERALRDTPDRSALSGLVRRAMSMEKLQIHMPLGDWLEGEPAPLAGVLMTHLHLDHVTGLPDVPRGTPVYAGPGETLPRMFMNLFTQGSIDRTLEGMEAIREWQFQPVEGDLFEGVVDVFGDGLLWAIWVPGHTPGSVAYLARSKSGPVLFVGDTSHTSWGWHHDVEPGTFTLDRERNAKSLAVLRQLATTHPAIDVRLGHQHLNSAPDDVRAVGRQP